MDREDFLTQKRERKTSVTCQSNTRGWAGLRKVTASLVAFVFTWSMCVSPVMAETINLEGGSVEVNVQDNTTSWNVTGNPVWNVPEFNVPQNNIYNISGLSQNASLALLVNGGQASNIFGTMNLSNLDFILQNIAGINIGSTGLINLNNASLIASTLPLNLSLTNFLARQYQFEGNTGFLMNEGRIVGNNADLVALVANAIENKGTIEVPMGTVALAAGNTVTVGISPDGMVSIGVDEATANAMGLQDQIKNSGSITADGGKVVLNAQAVDGLFEKAIHLEKNANAVSVVRADDGTIEFQSMDDIYNEAIIQAMNGQIKIDTARGTGNEERDIEPNPTSGVGSVINAGTMDATGGSIEIDAGTGSVVNEGTIKAEVLRESGYTFHTSGYLGVSRAYFDNIDLAATLSGTIEGGEYFDENYSFLGDVTFLGEVILNATGSFSDGSEPNHVTLGGNTVFNADSDGDGMGYFWLGQDYDLITGNGYDLTIRAGENSVITPMSGIGTLTLGRNGPNDVTFSSQTNVDDIDVVTFKTENGVTFSKTVGSGTALDPYLIYDVTQLQGMSNDLFASYTLANNVDASSTTSWNWIADNTPENWTGENMPYQGFAPVEGFSGSFDGQSFAISDLYINRPNQSPVGLFGTVNNGMISNVGLRDVDVTGLDSVGALVATNNGGIITNAYVSGGSVLGGESVAGLVGSNTGTVQNSYTNVSVESKTAGPAAGLVAWNSTGALIQNTYALGNVTSETAADVGGLVGVNYGSGTRIFNSYAAGNVYGGVDGGHVGGLVGSNTDGDVWSSFAIGNVTGVGATSSVGRLIGYNSTPVSGDVISNGVWTGSGGNAVYDVGEGWNVENRSATVGEFFDADYGVYADPGANGWGLTGWDMGSTLGHTWAMSGNNGGLPLLQMRYSTNITDATQLQLMFLDLAASYNLANNIDASETANWNGGLGFEPVGSYDAGMNLHPFTGAFDGEGHTITGLTINRNFAYSDYLAGLFGATSESAVLSNVGLVDVSIEHPFIGTSDHKTGGLVGLNKGAVMNAYVTGSILGAQAGGLVGDNYYGASISNSYSTASVSSPGDFDSTAGGLVGTNLGSIVNSFATGDVSGAAIATGGLVGNNNSSIDNSYSTGAVTCSGEYCGGLAGYNGGMIASSYSTGNVAGGSAVGGLVGASESSSITNSYATGNISGGDSSDMGGLVGNDYGSSITNSYATGSITVNSVQEGGGAVGGLVGWAGYTSIDNSFTTSTFNLLEGSSADPFAGYGGYSVYVNNSYYTDNTYGTWTSANYESGGGAAFFNPSHTVYTVGTPWSISSTLGSTWAMSGNNGGLPLLQMRYSTNITDATSLQLMFLDLNANYTLANNIDASETATWNGGLGFEPIGSSPYFTGTFNGQGYTISGLTINRPATDTVGLFSITEGASIQNVGLVGGSVTGQDNVGGLVGWFSYGSSFTNAFSGADVQGRTGVGGFGGQGRGTTFTNVHATGDVTGTGWAAGGFAGTMTEGSSVNRAYATGNVFAPGVQDVGGFLGVIGSSSSLSNVYATGNVTGSNQVGGLVGAFYDGNTDLSYGYSTGLVSAASNAGGLIGMFAGGTLTNNYWNTETSGQAASAGQGSGAVEGKTTAEMVNPTTFSNWDIASTHDGSVWAMSGNNGAFPLLQMRFAADGQIHDATQLQLMYLDLTKSYALANDIDASDTLYWNGGQGFEPIGSQMVMFDGALEGNGNVISDLYINRPSQGYVGLFANLNGAVQNIGIVGTDPSVTYIVAGGTSGVLAGRSQGSITNAYTTESIIGNGWAIGGLVGQNAGAITDSYAVGNVTGGASVWFVGGLVGYSGMDINASITNSYAAGNVTTGGRYVGGLVGYAPGLGSINNSYAVGAVSGDIAGGLAGYSTGTITNSGWYGISGVGSPAGGNAIYAIGETNGSVDYESNDLTSSFFNKAYGIYSTWDSASTHDGSVWAMSGNNGGLPLLQMRYSTNITDAIQLQLMYLDLAANYTLANDIDASSTVNWNGGAGFEPVGFSTESYAWADPTDPFTGSLDGQGHAISDLTINRPSERDVGLFGYTQGASISDLGLVDPVIAGSNYVGALIANSKGDTIARTYVSGGSVTALNTGLEGYVGVGGLIGNAGSLTLSESFASAAVNVDNTYGMSAGGVGGLVGLVDYYIGSSSAISDVYATGDVTGHGPSMQSSPGFGVGGLAGNVQSGSSITNAYATGSVVKDGDGAAGALAGYSGSSVSNAFATGFVNGSEGSLIGSDWGTTSNSYYNTDPSAFFGNTHPVYSGWNFQEGGNWDGYSDSLPHLQWENYGSPIDPPVASSILYWIYNGMGDNWWSIGSNWSSGLVPTATDSVGFDSSYSNYDILIDVDITVTNFTIGNGYSGTIFQSGSVTVTGDYAQTSGAFQGDSSFYNFSVGGSFSVPEYGQGTFFRYSPDMSGNYVIHDVYDLQAMKGFLSSDFVLANDIDASSTSHWNSDGMSGFYGFDPVGDGVFAYSGIFDGAGHVITGLTINRSAEGNVGLFGHLNHAEVRNVGLTDLDIRGLSYVGGLAGQMVSNTSIIESYATGSINFAGDSGGGLVGYSDSSSILRSYAIVNVTGTGDQDAGGLAGTFYSSTIEDSYAGGDVSMYDSAGGLVGDLWGSSVNNSYATGNIASSLSTGGLVGATASSTISNSFATGTVTGQNSNVGGLVGYSAATITNSFYTDDSHGDQTGKGVFEPGGASAFYGNTHAVYSNWNFQEGGNWDGYSDSLPHLQWENYGMPIDPPIVSSILYWIYNGMGDNWWSIGSNWSSGLVPTETDSVVFDNMYSSYGSLINTDITVVNFTIVSGYWGTVEQQANVTITGNFVQESGTFIDNSPTMHAFSVGGSFSIPQFMNGSFHRFGAFDVMENAFWVRDVYDLQAMKQNLYTNFELANSIDASSTASWNSDGMGGHYGFDPIGQDISCYGASFDGNGHTISGLTINRSNEDYIGLFSYLYNNEHTASIRNVGLVDASVTGRDMVGALVGQNQGDIQNVYSSGAVTGGYSMSGETGGLVGRNTGPIFNSYSTANVSGAQQVGGLVGSNQDAIQNSYAAGNVTGTDDVGGLVGINEGSIANSSYSGSLHASGSWVGGLVGLNNEGASVTDSYSTGSVIAEGIWDAGGLVGTNAGNISDSYSTASVTANGSSIGGLAGYSRGNISNSYSTGNVQSNGSNVGALVGLNDTTGVITSSFATGLVNSSTGALAGADSGTVTNSYYNTDPSTFYGNTHAVYSGWDFQESGEWDGYSDSLPHLQWENYGSPIDPPSLGITIEGDVYDFFGGSIIMDVANVILLVMGQQLGQTDTSSGHFSFSNISLNANDAVLVYLNGYSVVGNTLTIAADTTSAISGLDIYGSSLTLKHQAMSPVTNTDLANAIQGVMDLSNIAYSIDGMTNVLSASQKLIVPAFMSFTPGAFVIANAGVVNDGTITGSTVSNYGDWSGAGSTDSMVNNYSTISDGTFDGAVYNDLNNGGAIISGGTFNGAVNNYYSGRISGGTFSGLVTNDGANISGGTFDGEVTSSGGIEGGVFNGIVTSSNYISSGVFTESSAVTISNGNIHGGSFAGTVENQDAIEGLLGGTFSGEVNNYGAISGGIFTGTVSMYDGSRIGGDVTFNNFTATTPNSTIHFDPGTTTTVNGAFTVGGDGTGNVTLTGDSAWSLVVNSASPTVTYTSVANSNASLGNEIDAMDPSNVDLDGNSGWNFFIPTITIEGNVYDVLGGSIISDVANVILLVMGQQLGQTDTSSGHFSFSNISVNANDAILVYLNGYSAVGNTFTIAKDQTTAISGLDIHGSALTLKHETTGPVTNAQLANAIQNITDPAVLANIAYTVNGSNALTATQNVLIPVSMSYTPENSVTIQDAGLVVEGTLNANGQAVTVDNLAKVTSGSYLASSGLQTFNGGLTVSGGTYNAGSGTTDINGDMILSGGTMLGNTAHIDLSGKWLKTTGTFTPGSSTVHLDGGEGVLQTVIGGNFYSMTHDTASTVQLGNAMTVSNVLNQSAGAIEANGQTTNIGTANISGGEYHPSTGSQSISNLNLSNDVSFDATNCSLAIGGSISIQDTATLTAPNSSHTFTIGGNISKAAGATFDHNNGTVRLTGGNQSITGSFTFYNLTKTVSSNVTLTVEAGFTQIVEGALTLQGDLTHKLSLRSSNPGNEWMIDPQGTRTVSYVDVQDSHNINATDITAVNSTDSTRNIGWAFPASSNFTWTGAVSSAWDVAGNWDLGRVPTATDNVYIPLTGNAPSFTGTLRINDLTLGSSAVLDLNGQALQVDGVFSNAGGTLRVKGTENITLSSGNDTDSGAWEYLGDGTAGLITLKDWGTSDYYNLILNSSSLNAFGISNALKVNGNFTLSGMSTFTPSYTVTAGATTLSSGSYLATTVDQTFAGLSVTSGAAFNAGDGIVTVNGTLGVSGSGSAFTAGAGAVDVNGSVSIGSGSAVRAPSSTLSVSGNFSNSGSFDANGGSVTFDGGSQTISGDTTFNNLSKQSGGSTLTFQAGSTQTITGDLTLKGASGNRMYLRSSSDGTQWKIDPQGAIDVAFVDVKDSQNMNGGVISAASSQNSLNNSGWSFGASLLTWLGLTSNWSDAGNWDLGYAPLSGDAAVIANTANNPILSGAVTVNNLTINSEAAIELNGQDLTVTSAFVNNGTVKLLGTEATIALAYGNDTDSGTWEYLGDGTGSTITLKDFGSGTDYYNLILNSSTGSQNAFNITSGLAVGGTFTLSALTVFDANARTVNAGTTAISAGEYQASNATQALGAVTLASGATLTGGSGTVNITGNLAVGSGMTVNAGSGAMNMTGGLAISDGGTVTGSTGTIDVAGSMSQTGGTFSAPSLLRVGGSWVTGSQADFDANAGRVTFYGSGTHAVVSNGKSFYDVTQTGSGKLQLSDAIDITHSLLIDTNSTLDLNGRNLDLHGGQFSNLGTLSLQGNETLAGFANDTGSGKVAYAASGIYSDFKAGNAYHDLELGGTAIYDVGGISFNGTGTIVDSATVLLNVSAAGHNKVYDGTDAATVDLSTDNIFTNYAVSAGSASANFIDGKDVGTGKTINVSGISLTGADSGKFTLNGITSAAASADITPKLVTVTVDAGQSKVYGDADPELTYASTSLAGSDVWMGTLSRAVGETVAGGPYAIDQGTLDAGSNYSVMFVGNSFTITPRAITVTADAKTMVYGDSDPALTYQITNGGLVGSDSISGSLSRASGSDVGSYAIVQNTLDAGSNYALTYVGDSLSITQRLITVTADAQTKVYGDSDPMLTYQITSGSLVGSDSFSGSLSRAAGSNVGAYAIGQNDLTAGSNYALTFVGNNFSVTPKALTVTVDGGQSKVYGAADPTLTYQSTGLLGGDSFSGALARTAGENVADGPYAITQGTLDAGSNYSITFNGGAFSITARPITVTADAQTKVYGDSDPMLTYQITSGSLVGSDSLSGSLSRTAGKNVGSYAIGQNTLTAGSNYALNYIGANFSITAKAITLSGITAASKVYDGTTAAPVSTLSAAFNGMIDGDDLTVSSTGTFSNKNVGNNKAVTLTNTLGGADLGNYSVSEQSATTANITAKDLTVTATGVNKTFDDTIQATVNLSDNRIAGDALNDTYASAVFDTKDVGTNKTVTVNGIAISGADAANYNLLNTTATTRADITAVTTVVPVTPVTPVNPDNSAIDRTINTVDTTVTTVGAGVGSDTGIVTGIVTNPPAGGNSSTGTGTGNVTGGVDAGSFFNDTGTGNIDMSGIMNVGTDTGTVLPTSGTDTSVPAVNEVVVDQEEAPVTVVPEEPAPAVEEQEAPAVESSEKEEAQPVAAAASELPGLSGATRALDALDDYFEAQKAKALQTNIKVSEGAVYVIDGENAMSLLEKGESLRVFYKSLSARKRAKDNASGMRKEAEPVAANVLSLADEPAVSIALETRVLKPASPVLVQHTKNGTRYGVLKNPGKDVFVRRNGGEWKAAVDGMVILPGDEVKTAAKNSVEVLMDGGRVGRIEIKEGSLFRIQKAETHVATDDQTTILDLALGKILVKVEALKGNSKFEVRTPTALTGVRGTTFEVTVKEKA